MIAPFDTKMLSIDFIDTSRPAIDMSMARPELSIAAIDMPRRSLDTPGSLIDMPFASIDMSVSGKDMPISERDMPPEAIDTPWLPQDTPIPAIDSWIATTDAAVSFPTYHARSPSNRASPSESSTLRPCVVGRPRVFSFEVSRLAHDAEICQENRLSGTRLKLARRHCHRRFKVPKRRECSQ
jgi:hypothetical protein